MTFKVTMTVKSIELTIQCQCNRCKHKKSIEAFGINPRTNKPYAHCISCRAKHRSLRYIGKTIQNEAGRRWIVRGYNNETDHDGCFPYTCHALDGEFAVWYAGEDEVREGYQREMGKAGSL